ncbi:MAG: hypothetical protein OK404_00855 [Thaumarchaeota archaeon]|nr:hypothetical protein [Nitrososphaerota archaeon]
MGAGKVNEAWHQAHIMPASPTREQRVQWHFEHAAACGCRPVPENLAKEVRAKIRAANASVRSK